MANKNPKVPLLQDSGYVISPEMDQMNPKYSHSSNIKLIHKKDVSLTTKVGLLIWKNYKSQFYRRKMSYICKLTFPLIIMLILGFIALS